MEACRLENDGNLATVHSAHVRYQNSRYFVDSLDIELVIITTKSSFCCEKRTAKKCADLSCAFLHGF